MSSYATQDVERVICNLSEGVMLYDGVSRARDGIFSWMHRTKNSSFSTSVPTPLFAN